MNGPIVRGVLRYTVLAALCLAATIAYICRNSIGVAESTIRDELGLSEDAMAWVMSSFFLAYALAQIPTGWWGNRLGARRALPVYAVAWSLCTGVMCLASGWPLLLAARISNGIAQAGARNAQTFGQLPLGRESLTGSSVSGAEHTTRTACGAARDRVAGLAISF